MRRSVLLVVVLSAACSKKTADHQAGSTSPTPAPAEPAPAPVADTHSDAALNRIDYDVPMVGEHKGGFDVSFALLHLGNPDTGQGDLVVFGPEVKPGDKGNASDWKDECSTRLNAFPYAGVHGFRIYISKIGTLPAPGPDTKLEASTGTLDLQGDGWAVSPKDLQAHPFEPDVRLLSNDGKEALIELHIREPGKDGSVRGRVRAKVCPPSE